MDARQRRLHWPPWWRRRGRAGYTSIANGRFKGGYITRHYGAPSRGVHAIQLEMCQSTYMHETAPFDYAPERAEGVQPTLRKMVEGAFNVVTSLQA